MCKIQIPLKKYNPKEIKSKIWNFKSSLNHKRNELKCQNTNFFYTNFFPKHRVMGKLPFLQKPYFRHPLKTNNPFATTPN